MGFKQFRYSAATVTTTTGVPNTITTTQLSIYYLYTSNWTCSNTLQIEKKQLILTPYRIKYVS